MKTVLQTILGCAGLLACSQLALGQGAIIQSAGPVNRGMGGASVAAPLDSLGALYWNPATISGLKSSETGFALDLVVPNHKVVSSVGPFSGSTEDDPGVFPVPSVGWVHHIADSAMTLGLGMNGVAGFGTNLPADPGNPVLAPPPIGLGSVSSNANFLQLAPVLSIAVQDNLSIAVGPTVTLGRLEVSPFVFDAANANGTYSSGAATRQHWGGGFQLGLYYIASEAWRFGASLKSTSWMETFTFNGSDANGLPRRLTADVDLPMIISVGTSYAGLERWIFALDTRYFDYGNTDGFGDEPTFQADGRLSGLGYSSVMSTAVGAQREVTDSIAARIGYTFNQNPVKNQEAFYNLASPLFYQHMLSGGTSISFSEKLSASLAYSYLFSNTRTGPIVSPLFGPIPGSRVENTLDGHLISFGLTVRQ